MLVWGEEGIWGDAEGVCWHPPPIHPWGGWEEQQRKEQRCRALLLTPFTSPCSAPPSCCPADLQHSETLQGRLEACTFHQPDGETCWLKQNWGYHWENKRKAAWKGAALSGRVCGWILFFLLDDELLQGRGWVSCICGWRGVFPEGPSKAMNMKISITFLECVYEVLFNF